MAHKMDETSYESLVADLGAAKAALVACKEELSRAGLLDESYELMKRRAENEVLKFIPTDGSVDADRAKERALFAIEDLLTQDISLTRTML